MSNFEDTQFLGPILDRVYLHNMTEAAAIEQIIKHFRGGSENPVKDVQMEIIPPPIGVFHRTSTEEIVDDAQIFQHIIALFDLIESASGTEMPYRHELRDLRELVRKKRSQRNGLA